jgi:hypothetical protein
LGGFRGKVRPASTDEFVGKLREWCDGRCEYKKTTGTMRIRKVECSAEAVKLK